MGKSKLKSLLIFFIVLISNSIYDTLSAAQTDRDSIIVRKCQDFDLTGDGSNETWKIADWINIPQQTVKPDTYSTKAKMLYSENGIYVLFDCQDKKLISTREADNLDLWEDDVVEVFLWTEEDFPVYFEYELSPLNYELPLMVPNSKGNFMGWSPWHYEGAKRTRHATSVKDGKKQNGSLISGWMGEIFIPYSLLAPLQQVPPDSGTRWRGNLYRIDYDQGETLFAWQSIEKTYHEYKKFGTFLFE